MPYHGRGGAGNIEAAAQDKERAESDPEAQLSTAEQPLSHAQSNGNDEEAYRRTGRGGAGNYYNVADDVKMPVGQAEVDAASKPAAAPGEAAPKYGRGGAGNIGYASSEKAGKDEVVRNEEEKMRDRVSKAVESYVQDELQVPQKARLPGA